MNKHEHKTCLHKNLKHCSKCDAVYCEDCDKEWGNQSWTYPWFYPNDETTVTANLPCGTNL